MGGTYGVHIVTFAIGGLATVKFGAVPGGSSLLRKPPVTL